MVEGNKELKIKIKEFYNLLESVQDTPGSSLEFIAFLRTFLRVQSESPLPTIEVMTLLKKHKPNIFTALRNNTNHYQMLQFLTELQMDETEAENNINTLLNL
jgi:hypothetical protein